MQRHVHHMAAVAHLQRNGHHPKLHCVVALDAQQPPQHAALCGGDVRDEELGTNDWQLHAGQQLQVACWCEMQNVM